MKKTIAMVFLDFCIFFAQYTANKINLQASFRLVGHHPMGAATGWCLTKRNKKIEENDCYGFLDFCIFSLSTKYIKTKILKYSFEKNYADCIFKYLFMSENYTVPAQTRIGHIHLKVSDLERSLSFYRDLLGFQVMAMYGKQAAFISAGGYHHHIGLNTWMSKGAAPAPSHGVGLYHTAIVYLERKDLAFILNRLLNANYPLAGASDHGVSEALYLNDPDNNGVELYWDRPKELWPFTEDGSLQMFTNALDLNDLLGELNT